MVKPTDNREPASKRGLECPRCGCKHFWVVYTRKAPRGCVRRRRECRHCGRRITTYEHSIG
jgi:transcriptional regulator NrdR family protein